MPVLGCLLVPELVLVRPQCVPESISTSYRTYTGCMWYSYGMHGVCTMIRLYRVETCRDMYFQVTYIIVSHLRHVRFLVDHAPSANCPFNTPRAHAPTYSDRSCDESNTHPPMCVLVRPHIHSPMTMIGYRCEYVVEHRLSMAPRP